MKIILCVLSNVCAYIYTIPKGTKCKENNETPALHVYIYTIFHTDNKCHVSFHEYFMFLTNSANKLHTRKKYCSTKTSMYC